MVIILVHWLIKEDCTEAFEKSWENMSIDPKSGLYREILTKPSSEVFDDKFHTFPLESPHYKTYLNIGIWKSLEDFDIAIKKYIPKVEIQEEGNKTKYILEMKPFEFKLRERIVLKKIKDRGGELPIADL